jgi:HEAT repeat protein
MQPAYGEALLSALRAGRTEVFSDEEAAFAGYQNDPAALQVVLKALRDSKAYMRRLAAEMLGRMGGTAAIPALVERLSDSDAEVRVAAIRSLADMGANSVKGEIILGLDDPEDIVRDETLASLPKLGVAPSPELSRTLERLLNEDSLEIRAHAAAVLLILGESKPAQELLAKLLKDQDVDKRRIALESYGRVAASAQGRQSFDTTLILDALDDPAPVVRREAIRVVSFLRVNSINALIVKRLSDEDATVRKLASESLKQAWPESRTDVIHILEVTDNLTLDSALDSIPPGDPEVFSPLRGYIQREVSNIRYLRTLVDSLPQEGHAVALLTQTLKHRESLSEERLIKAVGLFGNPRALGLIRKSLNAGDASTRAAALEALETLGDKRITQEVLPILDRGGVFQTSSDQNMDSSQAVDILLSNEDYWLRALAARSVPELGLNEFVEVLGKLKSDSVLLVQQAANDALARMKGDEHMKTIKTLSTLDRILLLREVPMFSRLSPEDLEQIAEIAQEQLYSDQAIICREDEPGNMLFIIVSGEVQVLKSIEKKNSVIAMRGAGEFLGEMAILESAPRSATLQARGDVRILVIEGGAFTAILLDRPEVAVSVLRHMSTRVRDLTQKVGVPLSG